MKEILKHNHIQKTTIELVSLHVLRTSSNLNNRNCKISK